MRLLDDLFSIISYEVFQESMMITIVLNAEHIIYLGHFPGFPVTPGVIQMQIVQELLEYQLKQKVQLQAMPDCKFLSILNPKETSHLKVNIKYRLVEGTYRVTARGESDDVLVFKLQADYRS